MLIALIFAEAELSETDLFRAQHRILVEGVKFWNSQESFAIFVQSRAWFLYAS